MQEPQQRAEPPSGTVHQVKHGRIAEREAYANGEVDETPRNPGPVRVRGDDAAQHEWKVQAG